MAYIEVKNKKGTGDNKPPSNFTGWLDYWEKKKGTKASKCEVLSCNAKAEHGGHVFKVGEGGKEYILPMLFRVSLSETQSRAGVL